jgi:APA family basic amino acid/polyamine antiporter
MLQGVWASLLSLTGSYETLLTCCVFVAWLNYGLCSAGLIWLRWKQPERPRGYRMWGAPWTTAMFSLTAGAVVVGSFITRPIASGVGLALIASGVPFYLRWRRQTMNSCNM